MKTVNEKYCRLERMIRDAYRTQPASTPREEWIQSVMSRVRQEQAPGCNGSAPVLELMAWRSGWVVAVAASIFAVLSLTAMPTRDRLMWDLYKGGAMAQLSVRMGE
jgi:hypothetical protein